MIDGRRAIESIIRFLRDETKRVLLVRGYNAKLKVVLSCLDREFNKGIIRTSSMSYISDHINEAFNKKFLPHVVKSTTNYKLGRMIVNINSYVNHTQSNPRGMKVLSPYFILFKRF
ncbi:hypothetical protein [Bacillus thuringiensis]|uniref:hypothetical protein n=1 Tax=Bacillus thuringiensis TaxID=1428 RepID=UPI002FBE00C1